MKNLQGWMILGIACLAGCVGTTIPVQAQQTATAIVVKERLVEHVGDRLIIDMKLALDELSLSANRSLVCTPLIERGDSVRALPPVIVNGRNRQIQYDRSGRDATANGEFVLRRHNGKEQTFDYHASIPFAKWMERSEVSLVADFCGCGWEALSNDKSPLFPIRIAEPVVLRPLLAYVTPEAERVKERVKEGSAFLDFPVNRTEIYPEYRDNPSELRKILDNASSAEEVMESLTPAQMVVKIVNEELRALMGSENRKLNISSKSPSVVMLVGLQGSGKTTSAGKIANLLRKQKMRPYLVPADVYRPAAIDQLTVLARQLDMPCYPSTTDMNPVDIARQAVAAAREQQATVVLLDTAGRLHTKKNLMEELAKIDRVLEREAPGCSRETLLVLDATTGQNGLNQAREFAAACGVTGIILTKLDGTAKGGVAIAIRDQLGLPIKFVGTGESIGDLTPFSAAEFAQALLLNEDEE